MQLRCLNCILTLMPFFLYSVHWFIPIRIDYEARAALRVTAAVLFIRLITHGGRGLGSGEAWLEEDRIG
jgi:hypothetical protein